MEFENPFTPSFGEIPAHLAGRKPIVDSVQRAFESTLRRPELTTLLSGARGTGKTTLMSILAHKAEQRGWIAVNTTSLPGMLDDIEEGARRAAKHLLPDQGTSHVAGIEIASIGGIQFTRDQESRQNWRWRMTDILDELGKTQTGLLITVDEIDPSLDEMIELAAAYQHFVREGRRVALLMAGLPNNISSLISNKTVSFLRRAQHFTLGRIADYDVRDAFVRTVTENGRVIEPAALDAAVEAIGGFAFLIQLVGFRSWDMNPSNKVISYDDVQNGIKLARAEMDDRILEATYRELSDEDLRFLKAMLQDDGDSRISDLTTRLNRSSAQVAQYRRRLIDAGVIGERRRGIVGFDLPYFKEFLKGRLEA